MFMRIGLFLLTNIAVLLVGGFVLNLIGINTILANNGSSLDLGNLLVFCAVFGFGGSMVSLFMSKFLAKMGSRAQIIDGTEGKTQQWLVLTTQRLADKAGIGMPEVAIFPSEQPNAFATGWNRNNALVAVSDGMLRQFPPEEIEAVIGHEIGHVANGDMITLCLIQGIVNTFVLFFARIIGFVVDRVVFRTENGVGIGFYIATFIAEIMLSILATMIVMWFSRRREYRADIAGATLASQPAMIAALTRLQGNSARTSLPDEMVAFGINGESKLSSFAGLFRSHPPIEDRIAALRAL